MIGKLMTYAKVGADTVIADRLRPLGVPMVWDSGAWSAFTGAVRHITLESHTEWVLQRQEIDPAARFIGLDVIGDPAGTLDNYRFQREAGANVEPVVHLGAPLEQVDALLSVSTPEWFNVGGLVGKTDDRLVAAFLAAVRRRLPSETKIHALGCTRPSVGRFVHFDGCDSTSWITWARHQLIPLFDDRSGGRWRRFAPALRDNTYRHAAWLRREYGLDPEFILAGSVDLASRERGLTAGCEAARRFGDWMTERHDRPCLVYIAAEHHGFGEQYVTRLYKGEL